MKILSVKKMLCPCCMQEHEVKTVEIGERMTFMGCPVSYNAEYTYCDKADVFFMNEDQMTKNSQRMSAACSRKIKC